MAAVMRALEFGEMLDGAFTLYRRNFSLFFGAALAPQLPLVLIWLLSPALFGGDGSVVADLLPLLLTPYSLFAAIWTMGALTHAAAVKYADGEVTIGEALGRGIARWFALAAASVCIWILIGAGLILLIVPGLIFLAMFFAVYPAIMIEGRGPFAAMGRSRDLSRGSRMRILGITLVAWLITMLPGLAMWMVAGVSVGLGAIAGGDTGALETTWFMATVQAVSAIVSALTMPFLLLVTVLLYYDRRARTEAPDLEQAAERLQQMT